MKKLLGFGFLSFLFALALTFQPTAVQASACTNDEECGACYEEDGEACGSAHCHNGACHYVCVPGGVCPQQ